MVDSVNKLLFKERDNNWTSWRIKHGITLVLSCFITIRPGQIGKQFIVRSILKSHVGRRSFFIFNGIALKGILKTFPTRFEFSAATCLHSLEWLKILNFIQDDSSVQKRLFFANTKRAQEHEQ